MNFFFFSILQFKYRDHTISQGVIMLEENKPTNHRRDWSLLLRPQKSGQLLQGLVPSSGTGAPPTSVKASAGQDAPTLTSSSSQGRTDKWDQAQGLNRVKHFIFRSMDTHSGVFPVTSRDFPQPWVSCVYGEITLPGPESSLHKPLGEVLGPRMYSSMLMKTFSLFCTIWLIQE